MKKRILALLLSGMMAVCLAACGGGDSEVSPSTAPSGSPAVMETGTLSEQTGADISQNQ